MPLNETLFQQIVLGALGVLVLALFLLLLKLFSLARDLSRYRHNQSIDAAVRLIEGLGMDRDVKKIVCDSLERLYRADTPMAQVRQQKVDDIFEQAQRRLDPPSRPR